MLIQFDEGQRDAAAVRKNAVVSAGAGSGKTTVLAHRFLQLISEQSAHVDEILTLTFTKKAAAEMYERIHEKMIEQRTEPGIEEELSRFDRARISTLDSFCSQIVRSGCLQYGISSSFVQDADRTVELARETALEFILSRQQDDRMQLLISMGSIEQLADELFIPLAVQHITLASPMHYADMIGAQTAYIRTALKQAADELLPEFRAFRSIPEPKPTKTYTNVFGSLETLCTKIIPLLQSYLTDLPDRTDRTDRTETESGTDTAAAERLDEITDLFSSVKNIKKGNSRKSAALNYIGEQQDHLNDLIETMYQGVTFLKEQNRLYRIANLLQEFQEIFLERKRDAGVITFQDAAEMAVDLLKTDRELRGYYKRAFRYIMIDEFQDNNKLQKDLLYLLAEKLDEFHDDIPSAEQLEPDKLFFVGDEKQSIYRFRGADVQVFKGLKQELESHGGKWLNLGRNYRSSPILIDFFNRIFPSVMQHEGEPYEADFVPLNKDAVNKDAENEDPSQKSASEAESSVSFFFKPFQKENDEEHAGDVPGDTVSAEDESGSGGGGASNGAEIDGEPVRAIEAEAWHIAEWIRESVEQKQLPLSLEQYGRPHADYDDIAVLLRSTSNQLFFERAFRRLGIPYTTQAARALFLEAPVNDIYLLLETLTYPMDRHAYAALLRSPFCNFDDRFVLALLHTETPPFYFDEHELRNPEIMREHGLQLDTQKEQTVWKQLAASEMETYMHARSLYRALLQKADLVPITELIRDIWYRGGYRYMLLKNPSYHTYLEYYDYLCALARKADTRGDSLALFLDELRPHMGANEKIPELELLREKTGGVQIMTIHKAKGLEFPVTVLANMGGGVRNSAVPLMYWSESFGPTFRTSSSRRKGRNAGNGRKAVNYFAEMEKQTQQKMEEAEKKRLLYVGMTRAEQHLVLSGCHTSHTRNGRSLLNMVLGALQAGDPDVLAEACSDGSLQQQFSEKGIQLQLIPDITEEEILQRIQHRKTRSVDETQQKMERAVSTEYSAVPMRRTVTELQERKNMQLFRGQAWEMEPVLSEKKQPAGEQLSSEKFSGTKQLSETGQAEQLPAVKQLPEAEQWIDAHPAVFGTLCHQLIEQQLHAAHDSPSDALFADSPVSAVNHAAKLAEGLTEELSAADPVMTENLRLTVMQTAERMAGKFYASELADRIRSAVSTETEVPFVLWGPFDPDNTDRNIWVRGQIDAVALYPDEVLVVDFKTDKQFRPALHAEQLRLYRTAAEGLYGRKAVCMVYYLRSGKIWSLS